MNDVVGMFLGISVILWLLWWVIKEGLREWEYEPVQWNTTTTTIKTYPKVYGPITFDTIKEADIFYTTLIYKGGPLRATVDHMLTPLRITCIDYSAETNTTLYKVELRGITRERDAEDLTVAFARYLARVITLEYVMADLSNDKKKQLGKAIVDEFGLGHFYRNTHITIP